jgi:hypothetical protein
MTASRKCYQCGGDGHFAASCPEVQFADELGTATDGRPPWCGQCDKRTRLIFEDDHASRCPRCNPQQDLPAQFKYCRCGDPIYRWDKSECGSHQPVGKKASTA